MEQDTKTTDDTERLDWIERKQLSGEYLHNAIHLMPTDHNEKIRGIKGIRGVGWFYDMTKPERDQFLKQNSKH